MVFASARIVNFPHEMFNDAQFYLEKAKKFDKDPKNDWQRWRYLRASIFFSLASLEAFVNQIVEYQLKKQGFDDEAKKFKKSQMNLARKIRNKYANLIRKPIDTGNPTWKDFIHIKEIRNRIAHYKGGVEIYNEGEPYSVDISNAEKGIEMVRSMIIYLQELAGEKPPTWIYQKHSKIIH